MTGSENVPEGPGGGPGAAPDAALLRGLTRRRFSRRDMFRSTGLAGGAVLLSACGVSGTKKANPTKSTQDEVAKFWAGKTKAGQLDFANWPLYIDVSDKNKNDHPTLDMFTKETGIKVKYQEVIQGDDSFFGKIQPVLAGGQSTGYDLMVITNGTYLDKLIALGYLVPLDHAKLPTFAKYGGSAYKNPTYDPKNAHTIPWQSGMTGIGYDPKRTGRKLDSWEDLRDPKFKGKVGMFGDTQDLPNCALLAIGVKPEDSKPADWKKAATWLREQKSAGLVRQYYEQNYIDPLSKGDIWASMAYSGDIFQANASGAHLEFVVPKEGAALWTDNMCIPQHAAHPVDAITFMDFAYRPEVAAMIAEYVNYVTPVPAVQDVVRKDAAAASGADRTTLDDLAKSPLVFPTPADYSLLHRYRVLTGAEEKEWNSTFEPIYQA